MSETTDILHSEGLDGVEKYYNRKMLYLEVIAWIMFIGFIFMGCNELKYIAICKAQDRIINGQHKIIQCYKSQSIMVNDYIKKGEVKVLRPKRND